MRCAVVCSSLGLAIGCGSSGSSSSPSAMVADPGGAGIPSGGAMDARATDNAPDGSRSAAEAGEPAVPLRVTGLLTRPTGTPAVGTEIRIFPAEPGARFATTDEQGAFAFGDVLPPYDLHFRSPSAFVGTHYKGLRTTKVLLTETARSSVSYWFANLLPAVAAALPDCGTPTCTAHYQVHAGTSAFQRGFNVGTFAYSAASIPPAISIRTLAWYGATTTPCTFRILVSDATGSKFWYGEEAGTVSGDFGAMKASLTLASPVPIVPVPTMTATVSVDRSALKAATMVNLKAGITFEDDDAIPLALGGPDPSSPTVTYPGVAAGGALLVEAATPPDVLGSSSSSFRGPLTTANAPLVVPAPPVLIGPVNGTRIGKTATISWEPSKVPVVYRVLLQTNASANVLYLAGTSFDLASVLGHDGSLRDGSYSLSVSSFGPLPQGLDAAVVQGLDVATLAQHGASSGISFTRDTLDAGAPDAD